MDGFSVCARLKQSPGGNDTPVLMITGLEDDASVDRAYQAGAADYITKPIHWAVLRNRVQHLLRARLAEELHRKACRRLTDIIDFFPDATFVIDKDKKVIAWNRAMAEMTGISREEMLGRGEYRYAVPFYGEPRSMLVDLIDQVEWRHHYNFNNIEQKGERITAELWAPALYNGRGAYLWVAVSPLYDDNGNRAGVIESIRDITDRKHMEKRLQYLSIYDPLTRIYNRTYFEEELRRLGAARSATVSIVICDVDGLKMVNECLGHDAGDRLLARAAGIIKKAFPGGQVVARIDGDEFAVLLPHAGRAETERAVERIRTVLGQDNAEKPELPISMSMGFAVGADCSADLESIFREANNSMNREKLHNVRSARSAIVNTLMKALEERDYITEGHTDRLQELVVGLGEAAGLNQQRITELKLLARFHDIGKVGIPDRILFKKGCLTSEEFEEMKKHCAIGYRIARSAPDLIPIAGWILRHHEWWNGKGYPLGLKEGDIPLECRVLSITDAFDAMTSDRPYRKALGREEAAAELERCAGIQFDPRLVKMFLEVLNLRTG
jgi:diguanylate cyclase (GGDEF)-like protein/PAS domain S-box-containing protein